jgi:TonB family protein
MCKRFSTFLILLLLTLTNTKAQNSDNNCPPLFTHERIINPVINIVNIEVIDSNKFDSLPKFKANLNTISKKIVYPEIAKRAEVEGTVKLLVSIDTIGNVVKIRVNKGYGAGLEEFAMDILQKEKFNPAIKDDKKVPSQMVVDINFDLNLNVDKPEMEINEIKYELYGGMIFLHKTIIFKRDGSAYYSEDRGYEPAKNYNGKINVYEFTKLNDFILAQCFFNYDSEYAKKAINDTGKTIITVKAGENTKSVMSKGQLEPVGLWAIRTVILQEYNQIKWEEVKE